MESLEWLRAAWADAIWDFLWIVLSLPVVVASVWWAATREWSRVDEVTALEAEPDLSAFPYSLDRLARVLEKDAGVRVKKGHPERTYSLQD